MIITFCGHSEIFMKEEQLEQELYSLLSSELVIHPEIVFYCGGYGAFDSLCSRVIDKLKTKYIHFKKFFITPYITPEYKDRNDYMQKHYDEIVYPELENVPKRFAISKRNEWMINEADLVIAYVSHSWGGAAKTLEYAERKHKKIINLATLLKQ